MEDHHIKVDILQLLDDYRLTVTQGTSDKKNVLFVVGKSSAVEKLEEFASSCADRINLKIVTVENLSLGKEANSNCWFDYLFMYLFILVASKGSLFNAILLGFGKDDNSSSDLSLIPTYTSLLIGGGMLIAKTIVGIEDMLVKRMKLCGFLNVTMSKSIPGIVTGNMPTYKVDAHNLNR